MRVYNRTDRDTVTYDYPDEMSQILAYLNAHGELFVTGRTVERLYREFSEDCFCAGWMGVSEGILDEFADWLDRRWI